MVSVLISRIVILTFGILYPAYASYKTVKTKNVRDYVKWMMYWIVYAFYTFFEIFTDIFLSFWFPFYYEIKILFVLWLICPATRGSTFLFRRVINPQLSKHEVLLDSYIDSIWDHGYDIARKIGAQGLDYLTHLTLQMLKKGQDTATNFLPKVDESAQSNSVIKTPVANSPSQNNLMNEDFDILMAESPESSDESYVAAKKSHNIKEAETNESDYDSEEDVVSVKSRPLKLAPKNKGKGMALRERKKKTVK